MLVTEDKASEFLEHVSRAEVVTLDTETTGLGTWTGDRVVGVAVGTAERRGYLPFRHGEPPNLPPQRLHDLVRALTGKKVRGFHLRFDLEMMGNEGLPLPAEIDDTILGALLMNENEPTFALKRSKGGELGLAPRYLGKESIAASDAMDQRLRDLGLGKGEMWKLSARDVAEYACGDLNLSDRLGDLYHEGARAWGMDDILAEYNEYQRLLIAMETRGVNIDRSVVERALVEGEEQRRTLLSQIHASAGYPLNPQSWKQVSTWLKTKDAQEETILRSQHPCANILIDYKAYGKRDSAYLRRFLDYSDADGVLRVQLNLTRDERDEGGTKSGRISCSRPNLTAMPKPGTNPVYSPCRRAVVAPPGHILVEADYSQAEPKIAGHYSQEPKLLAAFSEGRDMYQEAADRIGISRFDSKVLYLAIQYGAGAWKVAQMLGVDIDRAYEIRYAWHRQFPRIQPVMQRLQRAAEANGCIKLYTGRWCHFDGDTKSATCRSPFYTAWNRLVQGSVAEMVRRTMLRLWGYLREAGGCMLLQVHDSILFLLPTDALATRCSNIKRIMEDHPHWTIPPKVDMKVGPNWLEMVAINV